MGIRVLFLYPNTYGMNMLPPAVALFSALLKQYGHQVNLFDATYYQTDCGIDSDGTKANNLNVVPFNADECGIKMRVTDWRDDIRAKVRSFQPDLIAISSTEDMWPLGLRLLEAVEEPITRNRIPVIAGGVFPTFAPDLALSHRLVDMVCVGEGENAMLDLCERIQKGDDWNDVTNLWVKQKNGSIVKNLVSKPFDINETPIIDIGLFEDTRLYRPMAGKWYRMMPVETIRGCPYKCTFCNSPDQITLYRQKTNSDFLRKKSINLIYEELKHFKAVYDVEYNYFWADTFLAWNQREFDEFCEMYQDIRLPFWMQTRPETLTEYKVKRLKEVRLHRFNVGIEHGNDEFRRKILRRSWKNKDIIEVLKIPHRHGVQLTCNNIVGFPTETRELAMETIELNWHVNADSQNLTAFVPFHGIPLRKMAEDLGLIKSGEITKCLTNDPQIDMPQFPKKEVLGLTKCFVLYVKFPKNRWNEIRQAEQDTPEGRKILSELREECQDKYFSKNKESNSGEDPSVADLEYGLEYPTSPHS